MKAQATKSVRSKVAEPAKQIIPVELATFTMNPTSKGHAFGHPGIEPRWTHGDKDGVGTAFAASSRIWFTLWNGIITEVYYPTVDRPQIRDLQFLITDGETFFHEERRDLKSKFERLSGHALGYRQTNEDPAGRYTIIKEIIADPSLCLRSPTRAADWR